MAEDRIYATAPYARDLKRTCATLAAQIARRQHHLRTSEEQELLSHRAERLQADIDDAKAKLAALVAEHAVLVAKLPA